ncbi:MAG: hypothetical protein JWR54_3439 [Mucilaginibacter sp.]|nr:hypothetical protein [Mucilaginibacter sp.]
MENKIYKLAAWPAFVHGKCPRCRRGDIFVNRMYGFHGQVMNKTCPHCCLTYEIEPGYFYVAMLVSYAMNVAEMVTLAVVIHILTGSENPWLNIVIILGLAVVVSPFNFRYSRVMLLHWLTPGLHYHPEMSEEKNG